MAYIQRIALYSHQLTITARVKADVQMISGELVVSGVSGFSEQTLYECLYQLYNIL